MKLARVALIFATACLLVYACTPKAVDCRVEFLRAADAGKDVVSE